MIKKWEEVERTPDGDYKIFKLSRVKRRSPLTEDVHEFVVLDAPHAVNVIPITEDGMVILVRQYRHGIDRVMLEFPAGLVDPGEEEWLEKTVARELREETGYTAEFIVKTGAISPIPAFYNGRTHTFAAFGCTLTAAQSLDTEENIEVELVPLNDIDTLIEQGFLDHAQDISAFYFFKQYIQNQNDD